MDGSGAGTRAASSHASTARCDDGFSVVEVLIAAGLLLVVAIGLLPIFTRSMMNNVQGGKSTQVTNLAKSRLEELYQLPFGSPSLTLEAGQTERRTREYFSTVQDRWIDEASWTGSEPIDLVRRTRIRQFNVAALEDNGEFDDGEALAGGVSPSTIHIKEIEVRVQSATQLGALGAGKGVTLKVYKPF